MRTEFQRRDAETQRNAFWCSRRLGVSAFILLLAPLAFAQHETPAAKNAENAAEHVTGGEEHGTVLWKWANFAVLVGGLGYVIRKNAGPFFANRTRTIRKGIAEAEEMRGDADARVAAVEAKLASLDNELAALRREALGEQTTETERVKQETAAELAKIQAHAQQEIASAGKAARLELKRYSAQLALAAAEQKIRARMTPDREDALVRGFIRSISKTA